MRRLWPQRDDKHICDAPCAAAPTGILTRNGNYARMSFTSSPCTSVRRKWRPWYWKVSLVWSTPKQ